MPGVDLAQLGLGQSEVKYFFEVDDWLNDLCLRYFDPDPCPRSRFSGARVRGHRCTCPPISAFNKSSPYSENF